MHLVNLYVCVNCYVMGAVVSLCSKTWSKREKGTGNKLTRNMRDAFDY